ncbi:MAG: DUF2804 domain-containing protein [Chitinophagales bacterium]
MILPAQSSLLQQDTHLPTGIYEGLIPDVSTSRWDTQGILLKSRRTSRKAWVFMGVYSPELICGIAIADAGLVANAFTYFYSFKDNIFVEDSVLVPLGFSASFNPSLDSEWQLGKFRIITKDGQMQFSYTGRYELNISVVNTPYGASVVAPGTGSRPFHFTYKNVCLPTQLNISYKGKTYEVNGPYGALDFSKGYPPRNTYWNWLAFTGTTQSGKKIGVNLVKHFNDELENILWIDGIKTLLSSSSFRMEKPLHINPWYISTADKILECSLTPAGARSENVNVLLMKSIFVQAYGKISGTVLINGLQEKFTATGVCEDHLARW